MHNNSLIHLLKSFSPAEIPEFREFLISPYFNKKNSVVKLFDILKKHYPSFEGEPVSKKNIHSKLFPGKSFNDTNLRVLVHNLNELAKRFVTYKSFENDKAEYDFKQLMGLMDRKQYGNIDKMISKQIEDLDNENMLADIYSYNKFRLGYERIFFLTESHFGLFEKLLDRTDFEKLFQSLSSFYYIQSMKLYINVLNIQIIYKKQFDTNSFERMVSLIDKSIFEENPAIEIYYCIIQLFMKPDEETFYFRVRKLLKKLSDKLHFSDTGEIYINLTNYCNRRISSGHEHFQKEKFILYKEENELKLYVNKGYMTSVYYKNLVILALSLNEYKWVKEFIHDYKKELPEDSRENIYLYCLALYEFDMMKFEKALEHLGKIKYDELYLKYDSKILQLMIHYEMKSGETLISAMEAFRHFLSNNQLLPKNKKILYQNFYKFFLKIVNYNPNKHLLDMESLMIKLKGNIFVFNKQWMIRKIDKLISGKSQS